jgi:prepilin-type N-terminal cleavage/methylation domain-containing protein
VRKKGGFTLIEVMVALAIAAVLFGYSLMNMRSYSNMVNDMDVQVFGNTLANFIITSKIYCRDNGVNCYIYFVTASNTVQLNYGTRVIKKLKMPAGFSGISINRTGSRMLIDNLGFTKDACTIRFTDRNGGIHYLTVSVGTANVEFKG